MKNLLFVMPFFLCFMISCQDKQVIAELEACKTQIKIEELNKSVVQSYWNGKWNERRPAIHSKPVVSKLLSYFCNILL
jgi:hypothetical protein